MPRSALPAPEGEGFPARLRRLRRDAGLSQRALAGAALSPSLVSLLESGRRTPTPATVAVLAARLGVAPEELLGDDAGAGALSIPVALAEASLGLGRPAEALVLLDPFAARWTGSALPVDALELRAALAHATALERVGRLDDAVAVLEVLRRVEERWPGHVDALRLGTALVRCYRDAGDLSRAVELGEATLARLGTATGAGSVARSELVSTLAGAYSERGDLVRSAALLDEVLDDPQQSLSDEARAKLLWNAAITAAERGRPARALALVDEASALLASRADLRSSARIRVTAAWVRLAQDPPAAAEARALLRVALPLLRQHDSSLAVASAETELARCELALGRPDVAERHARSALRRLTGAQRMERARALAALGLALLRRGDAVGGGAALDEAATALSEAGSSHHASVVWRQLADAHLAAGDPAAALRAAQQALDAAGVVRDPVATAGLAPSGRRATPRRAAPRARR